MSKLEHIATIDYCYWRLGKLNEALSKPKSAIEQLVDKACGYNEKREQNWLFVGEIWKQEKPNR